MKINQSERVVIMIKGTGKGSVASRKLGAAREGLIKSLAVNDHESGLMYWLRSLEALCADGSCPSRRRQSISIKYPGSLTVLQDTVEFIWHLKDKKIYIQSSESGEVYYESEIDGFYSKLAYIECPSLDKQGRII